MKRLRKSDPSSMWGDIGRYIMIIALSLIFAGVASLFSFRIDLTTDRRHTLSKSAREILSSLHNDVFIQVYLDGEMPVEFKRLRRSVRSMLEEFRVVSDRKVDFRFINPAAAKDEAQRNRYQSELEEKGLNKVKIMDTDDEGGLSEKLIFPGMIVSYQGVEMPVNFLKNNPTVTAEQNLLHSIEGLEYEIIRSVATISADTVYRVAFLEGHGELDELHVADLTLELAKYFTIDRGTIGGIPGVLDGYSAIVIAGPVSEFAEEDKLVIDQYIMNGGRVMWLVDEVYVNQDSLAMGGSLAIYSPLNIEDQLFKYGVRINPVIVQDMDCIIIPVQADVVGQQQQYMPVPWLYYPLLYPSAENSITRNINKVKGTFVNTIDTVVTDSSVRKEILLATSPYSREVSPPRIISLDEYRYPPPEEVFVNSFIPVAVALEGSFPSLFSGRIASYNGSPLVRRSTDTRMIVIADGDIAANDVSVIGNRVNPLPLGYDRYTRQTFGNKDLMVNCLNWLVDESGIMELRSREVKIRLLDRARIDEHRLFWQLFNTAGPILIVLIIALIFSMVRQKKYGSY
ncbi:MAG: gliding motility-associated ABC transporter substrate-binding protein GldG [Bacteroidia bacterium]|nr:MAG: gliding motility-associated ABC transporter substrate-binding protein GldG [Bacteroidia bacterium]